jgi:hypothetical protein
MFCFAANAKSRNRVSQDAGFMRQLECYLSYARELQGRSRAQRQRNEEF